MTDQDAYAWGRERARLERRISELEEALRDIEAQIERRAKHMHELSLSQADSRTYYQSRATEAQACLVALRVRMPALDSAAPAREE